MGEFDLIARGLERLGGRRAPGLALGSGDDAAVFAGGPWPVVTVDTMVEGTHWDPRLSDLADVGAKLLAVNLSDVAAMGAEPGPFLLALSLFEGGAVAAAGGLEPAFDALCRGLAEARSAHRLDPEAVVPVGGDVTRSAAATTLTLVQFGRPWRADRLLTRSGARVGDALWVSGPLGGAAAGLAWLQADEPRPPLPPGGDDLCRAHRRPRARTDLAAALARCDGVHACLDLSDGLAGDLYHVLRASGVGAEVELASLPLAPGLLELAEALGLDPHALCLGGGEDFELLLAADPAAASELTALGCSEVGRVVAGERVIYYDGAGRVVSEGDAAGFRGYEHF